MFSNATKKNTSSFFDLLSQNRSPSAIAGGVACGMILGLLPKDNLLALLLVVLIAVLPLNQLLACVMAGVVTLLGSSTFFLVDWVGYQVLRQGIVSEVLASLYQLPLVPWLRLENTVVAGSVVVGALLWIPTYFVVYRTSKRIYGSITMDEVTQLAAATLRHKAGRETYRSESTEGIEAEPKHLDTAHVTDSQAMESTVETSSKDSTSTPTSQPLKSHAVSDKSEAEFPLDQLYAVESSEESILHETLIEVIRFKRPTLDAMQTLESETPSPGDQTMLITNYLHKDSTTSIGSNGTAPAKPNTTVLPSSGAGHYRSHLGTKEDSLRHILKHIHGSREAKKDVEQST
jgi:uncharacterized protein (TIGR03546 family)